MTQAEFRQWAMIHAMQGLLASPTYDYTAIDPKETAKYAVSFADALLEANTIDEEPKSDD